LRHLKAFLRRHNRRAEIIECCHDPKHLENIYKKGERLELESLRNKKIAALSGIANPESFEDFLRRFGSEIVYHARFADHHRYSQQEIIDFINDAKRKGAEMIITTEKDAVRLPRLDRIDIQTYFMRVEIGIISGQENFDQCISRICFL
jgi:tetraacyldisaccharide 4'-kinase